MGERRLRHPAVRQPRHPGCTSWASAACRGLEAELEQAAAGARGQDATSISVELVPDPDKNAKTKKWRDDAQQGPGPIPRRRNRSSRRCSRSPTSRHRSSRPRSRPRRSRRRRKSLTEKATEGSRAASLPDLEALVDAAADDLNAKVKAHYDRKPSRPQPQQQAMYSGGGMQVRGSRRLEANPTNSPRASSPR